MIVKDKSASIQKAHEISSKIISLITEETKNFECDDDPAEQIYLGVHILGSLIAKICISLDGYGKVYGIEKLDIPSISEWINVIANENIKVNKNDG